VLILVISIIQIDTVAFLLSVHSTALSSFVDERLICAPDVTFGSTAADLRSDDDQHGPQRVR
jgi:hypothetical protein